MTFLDKSQVVVWPLSDGAMVSQILWLGVKDVFTQIAKDVVGQGLGHGTFLLTLRSCSFTIVLKGDAEFLFRLLLEGVIDRGQRALVQIDRPSLSGLSVLRWPIVVENDSPLKTKPKKFDTEPVRSQLRDDCLLGCDRGKRKAEASEPQG
ncbi:hypothetical protein F2Q70_00011543 [Brassica cretica]|uniref:Uncharacterized protein n=1 Tax=Brassica cretica TaxID=69181 RepID=A0A3N6PNS2_BRACR|nr:hypothetical protein F2Q70_00011543 [Brassica cretica]KAF3551484.1 hypothetical protein DY000_02006898 [Brassica cretica]